MLDLHHQRMVARLRNIMDSILRRDCESRTVQDEFTFLTLEAEAYRAFVHRHGVELEALLWPVGDHDPCAEADSLYFEVLRLGARLEDERDTGPVVVARLSALGGRLLTLAQRIHDATVQARKDRLAGLRDLVDRTRASMQNAPMTNH
jgi:hypothetical protein